MYHYLLTPPEDLAAAAELGLPIVHLAFSLGADGLLHHPALPEACRGGLMLLGTEDAPEAGRGSQAVRQVLSLCRDRRFRGVVLDAEGRPSPFLSDLIGELDRGLAQMERGFFLPEAYANFSRRAFLFLSSALSGGSLAVRLAETADNYGAERLVLALEPVAEDFPLPAPEGNGRPLTPQELEDLMGRLRPAVHFSPDLCAYYFTYLDGQRQPRLVLFDRADSLRRKMAEAEQAGIRRFFLLYPALAHLLPQLLSDRKPARA